MPYPDEVRARAKELAAAIEGEVALGLTTSVPFMRMCEVLAEQGCIRVDVEDSYYCRDYMSEYSFLYGRIMEDVGRWATRLHFSDSLEGGSDRYLGYTVLRPLLRKTAGGTTLARVGRTVLVYRKENHYVRCEGGYTTHLHGEELKVRGTPFIQQDGQVMCCAHAAMWVANRVMSKVEATVRDFYPHEIARMSTERLTRGPTLPTTGLNVQQMLSCVQGMGVEPLYYDYDRKGDAQAAFADGILYRYVEAGIPVILLIPGHAVTVVGHTFKPDLDPPAGEGALYLTPTSWVPHFIVQDDASGPYRFLPNRPSDIGKECIGELAVSLQTAAKAIIVPLPRNILLDGETAEWRAYRTLSSDVDVAEIISGGLEGASEESAAAFVRAHDGNRIVLRTYLEKSANFKRRMIELARQEGAAPALAKLAKHYASAFMSRYIWVTEISTPDLFGRPRVQDRLMLGEILADTTSSQDGRPEFAIHVPGTLLLSDPRNPYAGFRHRLEDDRPYPHNVLWGRGADGLLV